MSLRASSSATTRTLEDVDVECTHCGVRMSSHVGSGGQVRYFHCPSCQRWSSSVYTEVFRADTKLRTRKPTGDAQPAAFGAVKERLARWLESLSVDDPWRVLGCRPSDSEEAVRQRYLALARVHHPDAGGSAEQMRRVNEAYERIVRHQEARAAERLGSGQPATP